jgi:hypothetical protein
MVLGWGDGLLHSPLAVEVVEILKGGFGWKRGTGARR